MESSKKSAIELHELLSNKGLPFFLATKFRETGTVHNTELKYEEASFIIECFLNRISRSSFQYNRDVHCKGAIFAWSKSQIRRIKKKYKKKTNKQSIQPLAGKSDNNQDKMNIQNREPIANSTFHVYYTDNGIEFRSDYRNSRFM